MMKQQTPRTAILFLFILMVFYCYGAGMMDYFTIYKPWKLIAEEDFARFHQYQGQFVISIFVIPSAVMTLLNILVVLFPPPYLDRKLPGLALAAYAFDWIFSFTMQIPIQLELEKAKSMALLDELLRTNWWRFTADTIQFVIVCILFWQLLRRLEGFPADRNDSILSPEIKK
ncbi:hypothetical protein [Chitinophaga sp. 22620]|uniref:hypothetical protein n=1 Tax=Chitinophaga sp. 22620 TaxID=3453952 RepID=UPI003F86BFA1